MSTATAPFLPLDPSDPAVPGDPWIRVRYSYGQLLGAEDFATEQRAIVLRRRVHHATQHGAGVIAGLDVTSADVDGGDELRVTPGLAVDALGREIRVDRVQCLPVAALHTAALWATLPEGAEPGSRRAYVVLRYGACLSEPIPAIAPPCRDLDDVVAYGRVADTFRLCLEAEPPADPHAVLRPWHDPVGRAGACADLRARWLAFSLRDATPFDRLWTGDDDAGVLLATVDLRIEGDATTGEVTRVEAIDVAVRPLLLPVQALAEWATGHRLVGPDTCGRVRALEVTSAVQGTDLVVTVALSGDVDPTTLGAVSLRTLGASGWTVATPTVATASRAITLTLAAPSAATTLQVLLVGAGAGPLLDTAGEPLAGWWDDPNPPAGRGRDVAHTFTWTP